MKTKPTKEELAFAEKCETAAKIVREGLEWDYLFFPGESCGWMPSGGCHLGTVVISKDYDIRIKPGERKEAG